jgi:hypothetical protein
MSEKCSVVYLGHTRLSRMQPPSTALHALPVVLHALPMRVTCVTSCVTNARYMRYQCALHALPMRVTKAYVLCRVVLSPIESR